MGIFDWLFKNELNKDIEKIEKRRGNVKKHLDELKEKKKIAEQKEAEYEAFLNENRRVLCDDGVERVCFFNRDIVIEAHIRTLKANKITESVTKDMTPLDALEKESRKKYNVSDFHPSIDVLKWFNKKGETLNKDEILLYRQAMIDKDEALARSRKPRNKYNHGYITPKIFQKILVIINDYAFEAGEINSSHEKNFSYSQMFSFFSGSIDETIYKNGESTSKNKKDPILDKLSSESLSDDQKYWLDVVKKRAQAMKNMGAFINDVEELAYDHCDQYINDAERIPIPKNKRKDVALDRILGFTSIQEYISKNASKDEKFHFEASLQGAMLYANHLKISQNIIKKYLSSNGYGPEE